MMAGVNALDAPYGYVAIESINEHCYVHGVYACAFVTDLARCNPDSCSSIARLDGKDVFFVESLNSMAVKSRVLFHRAGLLVNQGQGSVTVTSRKTIVAQEPDPTPYNDKIDRTEAPAGYYATATLAAPPNDTEPLTPCSGCAFKRKNDCTRTSSISCTALGRKDQQNVIFKAKEF
jgi:hypothetical protein